MHGRVAKGVLELCQNSQTKQKLTQLLFLTVMLPVSTLAGTCDVSCTNVKIISTNRECLPDRDISRVLSPGSRNHKATWAPPRLEGGKCIKDMVVEFREGSPLLWGDCKFGLTRCSASWTVDLYDFTWSVTAGSCSLQLNSSKNGCKN